jgi:phosphatidylserine/phosphatidylglycerophosphate/cardiolipin synthase-like enzyme
MAAEVLFTRAGSVTEVVERLIHSTTTSLDAALYRFNSPRLARVLDEARLRHVRIRLVLDRNKYQQIRSARELLSNHQFPFRLLHGRQGQGSKMHHKFVVLDGETVLTGSYNWTLESEERNYENLLILRDPQAVGNYTQEFEALWAEASEP